MNASAATPVAESASGAVPRRGLRFILAGGLNTLFGWGVYSLGSWAGLPSWAALATATLLGIAFNFMTVGGYVFRAAARARLPRFISAYLLVYGVNLGLLQMVRPWLSEPIVAQAVLTPPMALLSYALMSRWVFADGGRA